VTAGWTVPLLVVLAAVALFGVAAAVSAGAEPQRAT
jgi:hypothetical protein